MQVPTDAAAAPLHAAATMRCRADCSSCESPTAWTAAATCGTRSTIRRWSRSRRRSPRRGESRSSPTAMPWWTSGKARTSAPGVPCSAATRASRGASSAMTRPTYCSASVRPIVSTTVGKHGVRSQRACERPAEPGDRGVWVVPFAVHQPVDEPLHARPHGLEADGDDAGHDERDEEVAAGRQRRADEADDGDVAGRRRRRSAAP